MIDKHHRAWDRRGHIFGNLEMSGSSKPISSSHWFNQSTISLQNQHHQEQDNDDWHTDKKHIYNCHSSKLPIWQSFTLLRRPESGAVGFCGQESLLCLTLMGMCGLDLMVAWVRRRVQLLVAVHQLLGLHKPPYVCEAVLTWLGFWLLRLCRLPNENEWFESSCYMMVY